MGSLWGTLCSRWRQRYENNELWAHNCQVIHQGGFVAKVLATLPPEHQAPMPSSRLGCASWGFQQGQPAAFFFGEEAMDPSYSTTKWRSQHFVGSPEMATLGTAKQAKHVGWFHDPKRARRQPLPGTVYTCILNIAAASVLFPNSRHTLPQFPLQLPSPGPMWVATSVVSLFVLGVGGQGPDDSWLKALFHESGLAAGYPLVN